MRKRSTSIRSRTVGIAIRIGRMLASGTIGAVLMLGVVGIFYLNSQPDLSPWHTAALDEEYSTSSEIATFAEYLELEDRLFAQLQTEVYDQVAAPDTGSIHRYHRGSNADPGRWPQNWNRSYELAVDTGAAPAKAGVLLVHGLTDSPYSLRHIGAALHAQGAHVLSLRVPGHGTAPAALAETKWEDMAGAVELAMRHLAEQVDGAPLHMVGYSNGGALTLHYVLKTLETPGLPSVDGVALISPEIGVGKVAAMAIWQERVGRVLGLKKLNWNSINVEYDPFKYVSFPVNGGVIAHDLTAENRKKVAALAAQGKMELFPPVIAFQSVLDATVSAPALVRDLFAQLPSDRHELVAFDLNRGPIIESLLKRDPKEDIGLILEDPDRKFVFSVITNYKSGGPGVVRRVWPPGASQYRDEPLPLAWPGDVYSLAHISLPMPASDPLYGGHPDTPSPGIQIGASVAKGERGVLHISAADTLRLRWNPFYPFMEESIAEWFGLHAATPAE